MTPQQILAIAPGAATSFWPHTHYSPLTVSTYLYDCGMEQGPLGVIP